MSAYNTGILMTDGFSIGAKKPADLKYLADTIDERNSYDTRNLSYEGMLVYVKGNSTTYQKTPNGWEEFGFNNDKFVENVYDGLDSDSNKLALSARQGKVLDNKLLSHSKENIHITNDERNAWNAKAETTLVTQTSNGLMSKNDKIKLDGIATNANNYVHPDTHPATMITEDVTHRFVTDEEKNTWNAKAENVLVSKSIDGLMSKEDKIKLDGMQEGATNYKHPDTHPATMITQDSTHRFVTDIEKSMWTAKAENTLVTQETNGLMSKEDKKILDDLVGTVSSLTEKITNMEQAQEEMLAKLKTAVFIG